MKIIDYLIERKIILYLIGSVLSLTNVFVLSSKSLIKDITELWYLDGLLIIIVIFFLMLDYHNMRKKYSDIINRGTLLRVDDDINSMKKEPLRSAIDNILKDKEREISIALEQGEINAKEINDYISKWIHEIKIPISIIDLTLESIDRQSDLEELADKKQLIYDQNHRIKGLVDQALYGVKIASYHEDYVIDEVDVDAIIKGILKKNSNIFIGKGIELEYEPVVITTSSDRKWLSYAIEQILINAVKYSNDGGSIKIYGKKEDRCSTLYIEDYGIGIMKSDIDRIFDRGFTGSNGRNTYKSTGMGLYFTKTVLDKLSHGIKVESTVGEFTRFKVMFYHLDDYYIQDN